MQAKRVPTLALAAVCLAFAPSSSWSAPQAKPKIDPSFHYVEDADAYGKHVVFVATRLGSEFHYCAGSIIAQRFVLTAAHCVSAKAAATTVYFGADMRRFQSSGKGIRAAAVTINPRYFDRGDAANNTSYWWQGEHEGDIAVIKLARDIPADYKPLQLDYTTTHQVDGHFSRPISGYSLGYGDLVSATGKKRRDIRLKRKDIDGLRLFEYSNILLAVPEKAGYSICSGDSGGPIILRDGDTPRQIGVNSRADPHCQGTAAPASIADSYDWIRGAMIALKAPDPVAARPDYAGECVNRATSVKAEDGKPPHLEISITNGCATPIRCIDAGWFKTGAKDWSVFKNPVDLKPGEVYTNKLPNVKNTTDEVDIPACSRVEEKATTVSKAEP